jgi:hypothetical protein
MDAAHCCSGSATLNKSAVRTWLKKYSFRETPTPEEDQELYSMTSLDFTYRGSRNVAKRYLLVSYFLVFCQLPVETSNVIGIF